MQDAVPHRSLVKFISGLCDWIIINFSDTNTRNLQISTVGDSDNKYLSIFSKLEGGKSSLKSILPDSTSFFIDLPLKDAEAFMMLVATGWMPIQSPPPQKTCSTSKSIRQLSRNGKLMRPQEVAFINGTDAPVIAVRCKNLRIAWNLT